MPKFKAIIMIMIVAALFFSLIGCSQLATRSTDPELVTGQGGDLPEWLLLAHRSIDGSGDENGILNPKEPDEDEDEIATDEPADQDTTQTASAPSSSGTTSGRTSTPKDEQSDSGSNELKPGTKDYLIEVMKRQQAPPAQSNDDDDDGDWFEFDERSSPSGWGN